MALNLIDTLIKTVTINSDDKKEEKKAEKKEENEHLELFWISDDNLRDACDYNEYGNKKKYPYIKYLPRTVPSLEFRKTFKKLHERSQSLFKQMSPAESLNMHRNSINNFRDFFTFNDKTLCTVKPQIINGINCEWITYKGSSKTNGVIVGVHGGGYCLGDLITQYPVAELLSKITGCVCLLVNYSLAPEHPLPKCINEIIGIYKYLINDLLISSKKICLFGDSAGGSAVLLAIQSLAFENISMPATIWCNSGWCNIACNDRSSGNNLKYLLQNICDSKVVNEQTKRYIQWAIGNIDKNGKVIGKNDAMNAIYCPISGNFENLCPVYFTCGATEMLIDGILLCAKKLNECNVKVKMEIHPYMTHCYPRFVTSYPEAREAIARIADWFMDHLE